MVNRSTPMRASVSDHVRNRLVRSLGKYLITLLFWLGFARGLAPELIQRVIAGQVPGVPARVTVLLKVGPRNPFSHTGGFVPMAWPARCWLTGLSRLHY